MHKGTRGRAASTRCAGRLLLGLAPGGGCLAATVTRRAGELLPHLFTLAPASQKEASALCLCGPIRKITPPRVLPGALLYGVRTFLDAPVARRDRPANLGI